MYLSDLLFPGEYIGDSDASAIFVRRICSDTRKMTAGDIFVALPGKHTDALHCLAECGIPPAAILLEKNTRLLPELQDYPAFYVDSAHATLAFLHSRLSGSPEKHLSICGITGTAGKSSTAELLYRILRENGLCAGLIGTIRCEIDGQRIPEDERIRTLTTPEPEVLYPLLRKMQDAGVTHVVMEVSSQGLALSRTAPIPFSIGIFTNFSNEHLDFHENMDNYFLAKTKLFAASRLSILNCDDPACERMQYYAKGRVIRYGLSETADYRAGGLAASPNGTFYCMATPTAAFSLHLPLPGLFSVYNSMAAVAAAMEWGVPPLVVKKALEQTGMISGRMEKMNLEEFQVPYTVIIDYAHTPVALEALLQTVRTICHQKIRLLFGCGGDRDPSKRSQMGRIAEKYADVVVLTADNSRSENTEDILRDIVSGMEKKDFPIQIPDRREAIAFLLDTAEKDDLLLLVGKGHETYEISKTGMHDLDERAVVKEHLKRQKEALTHEN